MCERVSSLLTCVNPHDMIVYVTAQHGLRRKSTDLGSKGQGEDISINMKIKTNEWVNILTFFLNKYKLVEILLNFKGRSLIPLSVIT